MKVQKLQNPVNQEIYRVLNSFGFLKSDLARIQTWNLLSRNQMRYSVAPRGLLNTTLLFCKAGANILFILKPEKIKKDFLI